MKITLLRPLSFLFLLVLLFFISCSDNSSQKQKISYDTIAQKKMLNELEIFLADTNIDVESRFKADFDLSNGRGEPDSSGYLEILQTSDTDRVGTATWMTYFKSGRAEMTGRTAWHNEDTLYFPDWVDTMGISQNNKLLAFSTHDAESDVFIELIDLPVLIQQKKINSFFTINPYPGICYFKRWENNKLIFSADINMLGLNSKKSLTAEDEFKDGSDEKTFSFDPATKVFAEVSK